jgi:hypothetical protein
MTPAKLRAVPDAPVEAPPADLSYEWRDRQRILSRDWSRCHIAGDRRQPVHLPDPVRRVWR